MNETDADGKGLRQIIRHYVVIGDSYRSVQMHNDQKVMVNLASTTTSTFTKHTPRACPIKVPNGVKLYLRPFEDNSYLLRVQNFNQQQASFTVPDGWTAVEYTLSANQLQADWEANRMQWKEEKSESVEKEKEELSILQKAI